MIKKTRIAYSYGSVIRKDSAVRAHSFAGIALLVCVVLVLVGLPMERAAAARLKASSHFKGTHIATPPQQDSPWQAPSMKLPKVFVSATVVLFRQGLADPRGCEYREIEVATGSCWSGDAGVHKVHGWVLPAEKGKEERFAVCWNGLVYPVVRIGEKADPSSDAAKIIDVDEERRAKHARERPDHPFQRYRHATPEATSASHESMLPLKACLLLRLGEADLAERLWTAWTTGMQQNINDDATHLQDPYIMLATDWLWALFDRAVCVHMRGDDNLALASARMLVPIWDAVEKESERRGIKRPYSQHGEDKPKYLRFLDPIHALLADQERRARVPEGNAPSVKDTKSVSPEARIAELIKDLEEVSARQMGQPGGVSLGEDPRVSSLIREGNAAVEPLLDCLENDTRLTRSVHFHRDFLRHRSLIAVHEAAYVALSGILKTSFFSAASTGDDLSSRGEKGRKAVAANIRAYWKRFKDIPLEERWYQILANDKVPPDHWLQVARNIVRPTNVNVTPGSMFGTGWVTVPQRKPGEKPKLRGEVLRGKRDPSVTELMAKRVESLSVKEKPTSSTDMVRMHKACELALLLTKWDLTASLQTLNALSDRCRTLHARGWNSGGWNSQILAKYFVEMTHKRAAAGNTAALDEYARWLQKLEPKQIKDYLKDVFCPLWIHLDHPTIAATAEWVFNSADSPWADLIKPDKQAMGYHTKDLFETPLVCVPAFRRHLIRHLGNPHKAGTALVHASGSIDIKVTGGWSTGTLSYPDDPLCPAPGTKVTFRVCDVYAHLLASLPGTPWFKLYWPEEELNRAVSKCASFLRQYGSRYSHEGEEDWRWSSEPGKRLRFPVLNSPANQKDVSEGRAIFSLTGDKVRVWVMPARPMKAKWTTLKDYPRASTTWNSKTKKSMQHVSYDQEGHVWQAEEVLVDGKWQRFFGFVGRYCVAKVPAEEIEFPGAYGWSRLSGGLDCSVLPPGRREDCSNVTVTRLGIGDPLVVCVRLRNRRGVDRTVPSLCYQRKEDQVPSLISGISIMLSHNPKANAASRFATQLSDDGEQQWKELTCKPVSRFKASGPGRTLTPGEDFTAFELDLHHLFDITEPGSYRLSLKFAEQDGGFVHGETQPVVFSLAAGEKE